MLLNKYSDFGGGKNNNLIQSNQFLSYNLMLNSGKFWKIRDKKNKYSNSRIVRKIFYE